MELRGGLRNQKALRMRRCLTQFANSALKCRTTPAFNSSFPKCFSTNMSISDFPEEDTSNNAAFMPSPTRDVNHPGWNPPQPREVKIDRQGRAYGTGGRKTSSARVWIKPGDGTMIVNGIPHTEYFPYRFTRDLIIDPFIVTQTLSKFDLWCTVKGGGTSG